MKTHYFDADYQLQKETHSLPANTGMYLVILADGRTSVEPYTVAFGWSRLPHWEVVLSSYLHPLTF